MARSVQWKRTISDTVSWRQDQGLNATIYIVREIGPTGFVLKEDGESKSVRVFLGDPHSCTCSLFRKEKDLCKHLCWLLLKKFKRAREDPISWQTGLVEREINALLRGEEARRIERIRPETARKASTGPAAEDGRPALEQRNIGEDDVCPICQEELLGKHEPVTYCKYGCANSIHIKCMKIWAGHQTTMGEKIIKCPFCREDFGSHSYLREEYRNTAAPSLRQRITEHHGTLCRVCSQSPITGKCYQCCSCREYHLCQKCFNTPNHINHVFEFRQAPNGRWRPAARVSISSAALPSAVIENLMARDIGDSDYDLLLQLDNPAANEISQIPESAIAKFSLERVRPNSRYLAPGEQCCICLRSYQINQYIRRLPCRHRFHKDCIDNWLLHQHPTCPIDGQIVWSHLSDENETGTGIDQRRCRRAPQPVVQTRNNVIQNNDEPILEIPGIGIGRSGLSGRSADLQLAYRRNSTNSLTSQPSTQSHEISQIPTTNQNDDNSNNALSATNDIEIQLSDLLTFDSTTDHQHSNTGFIPTATHERRSYSSRQISSIPRNLGRNDGAVMSDSETENRNRRNRNIILHTHVKRTSRKLSSSAPSISTTQPQEASDLFLGNPLADMLVVPPLVRKPIRGISQRNHQADNDNVDSELYLGSAGADRLRNEGTSVNHKNILMRRPHNPKKHMIKPPLKHISHPNHDRSTLALAGTGMLHLG